MTLFVYHHRLHAAGITWPVVKRAYATGFEEAYIFKGIKVNTVVYGWVSNIASAKMDLKNAIEHVEKQPFNVTKAITDCIVHRTIYNALNNHGN